MKTMYDAALPQPRDAVATFDVAAGYLGSQGATPHVWTETEWDSQPARYRLPIFVPSWFRSGVWNVSNDVDECHAQLLNIQAPGGTTIGLDMEVQVNDQYVSAFSSLMMKVGYFVMVYGSVSSLFKNPVPSMGYWPANPNRPAPPQLWNAPHVMATQYGQVLGNGVDLDLDVIADTVPLWDTKVNEMELSTQTNFSPVVVQDFPELAAQGFGPNTPVTVDTLITWTAARVAHLVATQSTSSTPGALSDADVQRIAAALAVHLGKDLTQGG
jgi:hypothetical protein